MPETTTFHFSINDLINKEDQIREDTSYNCQIVVATFDASSLNPLLHI